MISTRTCYQGTVFTTGCTTEAKDAAGGSQNGFKTFVVAIYVQENTKPGYKQSAVFDDFQCDFYVPVRL